SPNPLISDNNQELSYTNFSNPVIDINYNPFILNTLYYVRPYVISELGITYGEEISFTTQSINDIAVGNAYQGGMVGYILQPEDLGYDASTPHGLIIYFENENYELYSNYWGCDAITVDGTLPDFGSGQANTTAIINGCNDPNSAAKYCDDLISDGYEDWFLPSIEELGRINTNSNIIYESMGFDYSLDLICWTSTEDYDDIYNPFLPSPYIDAVYVYYFGSVTPSTETDVFPKIENASHPTPIPNVMAVRWF
ncbi:MAG: hypothetical protein KBT69_09425, partial [Oceanihabitans sp.]|nr:hypothetical protein [Oceanihabitans sp.]